MDQLEYSKLSFAERQAYDAAQFQMGDPYKKYHAIPTYIIEIQRELEEIKRLIIDLKNRPE